jgi:hypothetical protein
MIYFVTTGRSRVRVEANSTTEAMQEAVERIVSAPDALQRSLGQLTQCSTVDFDSGADDDVFALTQSLMVAIGFRKNAEGDLVRCNTCRGVGRLDCCEKIDCLDCGGLFTKDCPDCECEAVRCV